MRATVGSARRDESYWIVHLRHADAIISSIAHDGLTCLDDRRPTGCVKKSPADNPATSTARSAIEAPGIYREQVASVPDADIPARPGHFGMLFRACGRFGLVTKPLISTMIRCGALCNLTCLNTNPLHRECGGNKKKHSLTPQTPICALFVRVCMASCSGRFKVS